MKNDAPNNIAICSDLNQLNYALFNIYNINNRTSIKLRFHLIIKSIGLDEEQIINEFIKTFDQIDLVIYDFSVFNFSLYVSSPEQSHVNSSTFMRIYLSEIINEDKVLYLDTDTYIQGDVKELFDYAKKNPGNLGRAERDLSKANDHVISNVNSMLKGERVIERYFNAGVLVLDLREIRREGIIDKMTSFIGKNMNNLLLADQDVINAILEINDFHPNWNDGSIFWSNYLSQKNTNLKINHFFSDVKPWNSTEHNLNFLAKKNIFSMSEIDYKNKIEIRKEWIREYNEYKKRLYR